MARYARSDRTLATAATQAVAAWEFRAGSDPAYIREIYFALVTNTLIRAWFLRPANTPAGGTLGLGEPENQDDSASSGGVVVTGWTTAPTMPSVPPARNVLLSQSVTVSGNVGHSVLFDFTPGAFRVKQGASVVLATATAAAWPELDVSVIWDE